MFARQNVTFTRQTQALQTFCVAVARSTASKYNVRVMEAIVKKLDIPPFPLDDEERLEQLAQGFRDKSCSQLFGNVIGAFDGYLLRVSKKCLSKEVNKKKYFCRWVQHVY